MISLGLCAGRTRLSVLCIGAHADDIEIGAGGLILTLAGGPIALDVHWCVLSAPGERASEARAAAVDFLACATTRTIETGDFEDGLFPCQSREIRAWLAELRTRVSPDLILVHTDEDAHQDHREANRHVWNLFRDHLILEYEIPKWDGDLGRRNCYAPMSAAVMERKVELLTTHFVSQREKDWFDDATFRGIARLRGLECRAPEQYAEAFSLRKMCLI